MPKGKNQIKKIVVVGGGNIGTLLCAELLHNNNDIKLYLNTRNKEKWSNEIKVTDASNKLLYTAKNFIVTNKKIADADLYFFTIPKHAIKNELEEYLQEVTSNNALFVFIPGTGGIEHLYAKRKNKNIDFVGLQRVPFISRLNVYGHSVSLLSKKDVIYAATMSGNKYCILNDLLKIRVEYVPNYLAIALTPSNPILHTTRLYSLFTRFTPNEIVNDKILFYKMWDDESSEILLKADGEFQSICAAYSKLDLTNVKSLCQHYEVKSAREMTLKVASIEAFKNIEVPIKNVNNEYSIDLNSRYFLEDFNYGLIIVKAFAEIANIKTKMIDEILLWYGDLIGEKILDNMGKLVVNSNMLIPQNYGLFTVGDVEKYYTNHTKY